MAGQQPQGLQAAITAGTDDRDALENHGQTGTFWLYKG
jgi:hypothetical protein